MRMHFARRCALCRNMLCTYVADSLHLLQLMCVCRGAGTCAQADARPKVSSVSDGIAHEFVAGSRKLLDSGDTCTCTCWCDLSDGSRNIAAVQTISGSCDGCDSRCSSATYECNGALCMLSPCQQPDNERRTQQLSHLHDVPRLCLAWTEVDSLSMRACGHATCSMTVTVTLCSELWREMRLPLPFGPSGLRLHCGRHRVQ